MHACQSCHSINSAACGMAAYLAAAGAGKSDASYRGGGGYGVGRKSPRIWLLAADKGSALIFSKKDGHLIPVSAAKPSGKSGSFASEIADYLQVAAFADKFDRLVIVAASDMLEALRKAMDTSVLPRIVAEVRRDVTNLPEASLKEELEKIVWF